MSERNQNGSRQTPARTSPAADAGRSEQSGKQSSPQKSEPRKDKPGKKKTTPRAGTSSAQQETDFSVVAIGASAGGIDALQEFFGHLKVDTGLAYVVIQHLSADYKSQLPELLERQSVMPVHSATSVQELAPNQVFVIPEKCLLSLEGRTLKLREREKMGRHFRPIDMFFESLAEQLGEKAIGIILSGTGADGSAGVTAIKTAGGITVAQTEDSAKFAEMPRNARRTGDVDLVLAPREIAGKLGEPNLQAYQQTGPEVVAEDDSAWDEIHRLLRTTGLDFSQYKSSTIRRRIARRMAIHKRKTLADYAALLADEAPELKSLHEDLLIKVTEFFRDPDAFAALEKQIFPRILQGIKKDQPIRVWVPGCASGEEVYSLAMLLSEFLSREDAPVAAQIFGTDVSAGAIEKARTGFYRESRLSGISAARRDKFFVPIEGGFQVKKVLREMCVFAHQDFTTDPPFSRLNLISCRNVLIYFSSALQRKVLPVFHYALKAEGFLMLGTSENIGQADELFTAVDKKHRLYARKKAPQNIAADAWFKRQGQQPSPEAEPPARSPAGQEKNVHREVDRILLRKLDPAAVLVDEECNVLEFRGDTSPFVEHPPGKASLNLLKMTRDMLRSDLRTLLQRVKKHHTPQQKEHLVFDSGQERRFCLEVSPMQFDKESFYLVRFSPIAAGEESRSEGEQVGAAKPQAELKRENNRLRKELASSQDYVRQVVEEKDEALEDLKAANEEVLSSNEELQSINEEIETAKEELESSNEELSTVNQELQNRNEELTHAHNDLSNLISSVQIPFVIIDQNLKIRRVSDNAGEKLLIRAADVGRPVTDLHLSFELPALGKTLRQVMADNREVEREIRDRQGMWNLLRLRPYRSEKDGEIQGVVLALFDIDRLKRSMEEIEQAYKYSLQIVDTIKDPLLVLDQDLRVKKANPVFYQKFQVKPKQTEGKKVFDLGDGQWNQPELRDLLEDILPQSTQMDNYLVEFDFSQMGPRAMMLSARKMPTGINNGELVLLVIQDVTEQKQSEEYLRRAKQAAEDASRAKSEFLANISHEIRTPITVILSAVQYLRDGQLDAEQKRCTEMAEKSTASLLNLLDDILDFSKIEVDKIRLQTEPFDLRETIEDVVDILRGEAVRKGLQVDLQVAEEVPQQILGDWKRLRQVLINLIGNAIKFTEFGSVEVRLEKSRRATDGDSLLFKVKDTGIGIAGENLASIFHTFSQVDSSTTLQYGGTGLGLAICKGLVERMGGAIKVESEAGKGSTFFFTLPLRKVPQAGQAEQELTARSADPAAAGQALPGGTILLGEDDSSIRALTRMILEGWGLTVIEAETGSEVVETCGAANPDLILMDLQMPELDGLAAARKIREQQAGGGGIPIIGFTAHAHGEDRARCLAAGMNAVVTKPIDRREMFAVLAKFLKA